MLVWPEGPPAPGAIASVEGSRRLPAGSGAAYALLAGMRQVGLHSKRSG